MVKDKEQKIQDDEYSFPYHYIPQYQKYFTQSFNWRWGISYAASLEFMIDKIKSQEAFNSIVDIGCGDGRLTKELQENFKDKEVVGIDYSEKAIALSKLMYPQGNYQCLDIINDKLDRKFDIAILMEVFEHIPPAIGEKFLDAAANLIKKDGILLLTVPHVNVPVEPKHYRHFSKESLLKSLEKIFEIEEILFLETTSWKKKLIDRILTNKLFILNSGFLKNKLYSFYKKNLFVVNREQDCRRIFIKARLK